MTTRKQVVNRLKRARGQMDSLIANIESGVVRKLLTVCLCGFCPGRLV